MASMTMTMTASFLTGSGSNMAINTVKQPFKTPRRGLIVAKASVNKAESKVEENSGRRELVFAAAAAAAACSVAKVAFADEPKRGTPEARKKYGPVCVQMPTAKICNR